MDETQPQDPQSSGSPQDGVGGLIVAHTSDSHFAWIRTRLAAEATLRGWMGLATTLIAFGFTIEQFFDRFGAMSDVKPALIPFLPHYLGLALIFSGMLGLFTALRQYVSVVRHLHSAEFHPLAIGANLPMNKPALAIACFLVLIGAAAFVSGMFRLS